MSFPRPVRSLLLAFAAGCAPLTLALALPGQPAPSVSSTSPSPAAAGSPHAVAQALDAIVQPRFQDDRAGVFGTGRIISPIRGHAEASNFQPQTPHETVLWDAANQAHLPYVMGFLHCAHVPGQFTDKKPAPNLFSTEFGKNFAGPDSFRPATYSFARLITMYPISETPASPVVWEERSLQEKMQDKSFQTAAWKALPALMKGKGQETAQGNFLVVMRPVLAAKDSCLSCHTGAKKNDTLGVMVYAVSTSPVSTSAVSTSKDPH